VIVKKESVIVQDSLGLSLPQEPRKLFEGYSFSALGFEEKQARSFIFKF
jgi:hypothetical protein